MTALKLTFLMRLWAEGRAPFAASIASEVDASGGGLPVDKPDTLTGAEVELLDAILK